MNPLLQSALDKLRGRHGAGDLSLDDIRALKEKNEQDLRRELAKRDEMIAHELRQSEEHAAERKRRLAAMDELARDVGATSGQYLGWALSARRPTAPHLQAPYRCLEQLCADEYVNSYALPNLEMAIEARVALAGSLLPPVRADDKFFGGADKRLRAFPPARPAAVSYDTGWYPTWAREAGVPLAASYVGFQNLDAEIARVRREEKDKKYDRHDSARNTSLAEREIELINKRSQDARAREIEDVPRILDKQREAILKIVDRVLVGLEMGIAFWWAREFRRAIAGEPARLPEDRDKLSAWRWTQALGVRFPFETLTKD